MQPNNPIPGHDNDLNENKPAQTDQSNSFVLNKRTLLNSSNSAQTNDVSASASITSTVSKGSSQKKINPLTNAMPVIESLPPTTVSNSGNDYAPSVAQPISNQDNVITTEQPAILPQVIVFNEQVAQQPIDTNQAVFGQVVNDNHQPNKNKVIKENSFLRKALWIVGLLVIVGIGIGGYFAYVAYQNRPTHVFSEALSNSFHQTVFSETTQNSHRSIDAINSKNIIAYYSSKQVFGQYNFITDVYSSNNMTYVKYLRIGKTNTVNNKFAGILNKWVLLSSKGDSINQNSLVFAALNSAPSLTLGDWIEGNYTTSQTKTILSYIANHNIYSFNPKSVKKTIINNQETLDYPVSIKPLAIESYNKMVAQMLGMSSQQQTAIVNNLSTSGINKLNVYISLVNHQVVRTVANSNIGLSGSTIINYAYNNQVHFPSQPKAQISKSVFLNDLSKNIQQLSAASLGSTNTKP